MVEDHPEIPWDGVAPPQCHWFAELNKWWCGGLPPPPWPHKPPGEWYDPAVFGAPGTTWEFSESALAGLEESVGENTLKFLLRKLGRAYSVADSDARFWTVPESPWHPPYPNWTYMRYVNLAVVGKVGTVEMVSHTLKLRTAPTPDVDQSPAAIQTLADQVRDIWAAWFNGTMGNGQAVKSLFSPELTYTEVRAAYLESLTTGHRNVLPVPPPGQHKPKIVYTYDKPTYLVDTQYSNFAAGVSGTGTISLPWEVAAVMSLDSGRRGAANRGRTYLGPLSADIMGGLGLFDVGKMTALSESFATKVIKQINLTTGCDVHVVSKYWNDSIPVNSVRAGLVPDSQRRRRGAQAEAYRASIAVPLTA